MAARRARGALVLLGAALAASCTTDASVGSRAARVPLAIRAEVVAQQLPGRRIEIDVGYRRQDGSRRALEADPSAIPLEGGARDVPVTVTIEPCLRDADRAPAGSAGCALDVTLRLRGAGGAVEDSAVVRPEQQAVPGSTLETPSVQLFASYPVTIVPAPAATGAGRITSQPAGIDCSVTSSATSGSCSAAFSGRGGVQLVAQAATGSDFTTWGAAACGAAPAPCALTLAGPVTVAPVFTARRNPLAVAVSGPGRGRVSVTSPDPQGVFTCVTGTPVAQCTRDLLFSATATLTATADAGSRFAGWSGGCAGTAACTVPMTTAQQVGATFVIDSTTLAVTVDGDGAGTVRSDPAGITCTTAGGSCTVRLPVGSVVALTAEATPTPQGASRFSGWGGACAAEPSATCRVTLVAATTVRATFARVVIPPVTLSIAGTGDGRVTSSAGIDCALPGGGSGCAVTVPPGTAVALSATPAAGWRFDRWGGAAASCGTAPACPLTVTATATATAAFVRLPALVLTPDTLVFADTIGRPAPAPRTVAVTSLDGTLTTLAIARVEQDGGVPTWFDVDSLAGPTPRAFGVRPRTVTLPVGAWTARVIVAAPGARNPLDTVVVRRTVAPAPGPQWRVEAQVGPDTLRAVSGQSAVNIMAVGTRGPIGSALQYNGATWVRAMATVAPGTYRRTFGVTAVPGGTYFAATDSVLLRHVSGANWVREGAGGPFQNPPYFAVHAIPGFAFAVGGNDTLSLANRFQFGQWAAVPNPFAGALRAVWALSTTSVWASGIGGLVLRWDGGGWSADELPTVGALRGLWAAGPGFVVAVGDGGEIYRYNGNTWTPMTSPTTATLRAVFGTGSTNIFAVGDGGTILRFDGVAWRTMPSPTTQALFGVWCAGPVDCVAVGANGVILRYGVP